VAAPVYSIRIFAAGNLTPAAGLVGPVVPDGFVYVLRCIDVVELTGAPVKQMHVINQVGGILWDFQYLSSSTVGDYQWRGRQVYNVGEQVGFQADSGQWSVAASGYQLTLP